MDTKTDLNGSKLKRMRVYHFRVYWPSNFAFIVACVIYVPNLRKMGQKLRSLLWTMGLRTHRHTDRQKRHTYILVILYLQCRALDWTDNYCTFVNIIVTNMTFATCNAYRVVILFRNFQNVSCLSTSCF